jgi:hypothetical protein
MRRHHQVREMRCRRPEPDVPVLVVGELEHRLKEQVGVAMVAVEPVHKVPCGEAHELGMAAVRSDSRGCTTIGAGSGQHRRRRTTRSPLSGAACAARRGKHAAERAHAGEDKDRERRG